MCMLVLVFVVPELDFVISQVKSFFTNRLRSAGQPAPGAARNEGLAKPFLGRASKERNVDGCLTCAKLKNSKTMNLWKLFSKE